MSEIVCAYRECDVEFEPQRHNQIYCSPEHCREETNARLREAYRKNRARLGGKKRVCKTRGCGTVLSRYNEGDLCGRCEAQKRREDANLMLEVFKRANN